ncbi:class I SAM-dependent methyltransferase [Actinoallomurus bryophytorum]|uniref:Methyltransferase family protein n=1 Tax=Actinoallomurus bryophytorum TaxID=1490222 RepID=A0A543CQD6_9ACTN|nr:class I SAM-dependent methyltransferase [Actinoallomurus bryophytorum]TQL99316.1 methyltransferase family protein [Actinoallomurus bryophytorum]
MQRTTDTESDPQPFEAALSGHARRLELADGRLMSLAVGRWHELADQDDHWMLKHCHGPTIDLGCGPGRLVQALTERGVRALGVDTSPRAVRQCRARGAPALQRDAFASLPNEGHWRHVLLADGNIGIGGSPRTLLRRAISMVRPSGTVLLEIERHGAGLWRGAARLRGPVGSIGSWFPWAVVGADALPELAASSGLRVTRTYARNRRWFAELVRCPS